jgi:hypothetical protein
VCGGGGGGWSGEGGGDQSFGGADLCVTFTSTGQTFANRSSPALDDGCGEASASNSSHLRL